MGIGWFIRGDSKVKSIEELKSKNIGLGRKDYSSTPACLLVLKAHGITPESIGKTGGSISFLDWSAGANALADGTVDCQVFPDTSHGRQPAIEFMEQQWGVKALQPSLEKLKAIAAEHPEFGLMKVEAQRNYRLIKEPYYTLCVDIITMCRDDLPHDLVTDMLKVILSEETTKEFHKVAPSMKNSCLENSLCSWRPGWPIHPAAEKFYKQQGVSGNKPEVFWDEVKKPYFVPGKP
jgi:TRAP transporter TAXI family solute receptor